MTRTTATAPSAGRKRFSPFLEELEDRRILSVYSPAQIAHAYGFDQVTFANGTVRGTGAGQTIAIVDAFDDPNIAGNLQTFDRTFGLPDPVFVKATPQGVPKANAGWSAEIALDVEWAHALAPASHILLVEAKSDSGTDLLSAVNYAEWEPGVSVVSMSWNSPEFSTEASYDSHFSTPTGHAGVTFIASAGDNGAPAQWPAVSPRVLAVGGTSLTLGTGNSYGSESAWSSSSGGISSFETKPAFQSLVSTPNTFRSSPDVAYDADPKTAFYVYDSVNGAWFADGGTSAGAPQWAALVAIANQGRALAGSGSLDGPSQTLYALYTMAHVAAPTYFHDITTGSNGNPATTGYDLVTGLGSPVANQVIAGLVAWNGAGTTGSLTSGGHTSTPGTTKTAAHPMLESSVALAGPFVDSGAGIGLVRRDVSVLTEATTHQIMPMAIEGDAAPSKALQLLMLREPPVSSNAANRSLLQWPPRSTAAPDMTAGLGESTHGRQSTRVTVTAATAKYANYETSPARPSEHARATAEAPARAVAPATYLADSSAVALVVFGLGGSYGEDEPKTRT
jgi:hypothetical protein